MAYLINTKITTYTSSGTWTKDPRTSYVRVIGWGSGGGGGSGRKGASTAAGGGGGGAGGSGIYFDGPASYFGSSETVTIGALSAGGAAQTVDLTDGIAGSLQNVSAFGNYTTKAGTTAGLGGNTLTANGGSVGTGAGYTPPIVSPGAGGGGRNVTGNSATTLGSSGTYLCGSSGGGGGGYDVGSKRTGGTGASFVDVNSVTLLAGGIAGDESGNINGGNGNPSLTTGAVVMGGTGGGGGGGPFAGTTAGNGGDGAIPGGAGGGGGGGISTVSNSGAGGNGARGQITVIEFF